MELVTLKNKVRSRTEVVFFMQIRWCCILDCIFACGARRSKCNHEYSSLETVGDSGADPVPLGELIEDLHYCEMQTQ